jgi:hypothetical protein
MLSSSMSADTPFRRTSSQLDLTAESEIFALKMSKLQGSKPMVWNLARSNAYFSLMR